MRDQQEHIPLLETEINRRTMLEAGAVAVVALLGLTACSSAERETTEDDNPDNDSLTGRVRMETAEIRGNMDLIRNGRWQNTDGVTVEADRLLLAPTGLAIINKRGGKKESDRPAVANPPVNLFGSRLQAGGDFRLAAGIEADTPVSLRLFGQPPLRFDDFAYIGGGIEYAVGRDDVVVRYWDGSSQQPFEQRFGFPSTGNRRSVEVRRQGDSLSLTVNGQDVSRTAATGLFAGGQVWLGLNSELGPAVVSQLEAQPGSRQEDSLQLVDTSSLSVIDDVQGGLQKLVTKAGFDIGAAVSLPPLVSDGRYARLALGGEVGSLTPENGFKPQDIQPREGLWTFGDADALLTLAESHGVSLFGHTLVYGDASPKWMNLLPTETTADKLRVRDILETHIHTVVSRYRGRIAGWDVVNELIDGFNDQAGFRDTVWYRALGEDYIAIAMRAAHQADPAAKLYLNDFGMETNPQGRGQFMLGLAAKLRGAGVPLDGIGIQGHVYELPRDEIDPGRLGKLMAGFADLGLMVRVSELDVTADEGDDIQARQYKRVLETCLAAPNCSGLTVWGLTDATGSTASIRDGRLVPGNALPFDSTYRPKAAWKALRQVLQA